MTFWPHLNSLFFYTGTITRRSFSTYRTEVLFTSNQEPSRGIRPKGKNVCALSVTASTIDDLGGAAPVQ